MIGQTVSHYRVIEKIGQGRYVRASSTRISRNRIPAEVAFVYGDSQSMTGPLMYR